MKTLIVTVTTMSILIINVCCFRYEYPKNVEIIKHDLSFMNIPKQFDARKKWSNCSAIDGRIDSRPKWGQEWAVISASVMSDRLCIQSEGRFTESLSAEELFECAVISRGGEQELIGNVRRSEPVRWESFNFWKEHGIVTEKCKSLLNETIFDFNPPKICHYTCQDNTLDYRGEKTFGLKTLQSNRDDPDPRQIQVEIMSNGPVLTLMPAGSPTAPDGVLHYDEKLEGNWYWYLKIIGWDVSKNRLTWLAIDAYNYGWCRGGDCHLEFGKGGFERHVYAGVSGMCKTNHLELPPQSDANDKLMVINKSPLINVFAADLLLLISFGMMLMVY